MSHLHYACNVSVKELGNMRKRLLVIIILMTLDIGLILKIDTVFVAKIVPVWSIGIV